MQAGRCVGGRVLKPGRLMREDDDEQEVSIRVGVWAPSFSCRVNGKSVIGGGGGLLALLPSCGISLQEERV